MDQSPLSDPGERHDLRHALAVLVLALSIVSCTESRTIRLFPSLTVGSNQDAPPTNDEPNAGPQPSLDASGIQAPVVPDASPVPTPQLPSSPDAQVPSSCCDSAADEPDADTPPSDLIYRWEFEGDGAIALDSETGAPLSLEQGARQAGGLLELDGLAAYGSLPRGFLKDLTTVTITAWVFWDPEGGAPAPLDAGIRQKCFQRIFDFGNDREESTPPERVADNSVYLSPDDCDGRYYGGRYQHSANNLVGIQYNSARRDVTYRFPIKEPVHVALVLDGDARELRLYSEGARRDVAMLHDSWFDRGEGTSEDPNIWDTNNNWIGRSQWEVDAPFAGTIDDFRVYGAALTDNELAALALPIPYSFAGQ